MSTNIEGIKHKDPGGTLTHGEFIAADGHSLASGTSFPGSPSEGDLFYRTDEHKWYIYDGTSWVSLGAVNPVEGESSGLREEHGEVNVAGAPVAVTFDTAFSSTPTVVTGQRYSSCWSYTGVQNKSTTGFEAVRVLGSGWFTAEWLAIGPA